MSPAIHRVTTVVAVASALALVAVSPAVAQSGEEPIDAGPTPPEINNPTGDEAPEPGDVVDPEVPDPSETSEGAVSGTGGEVGDPGSGSRLAAPEPNGEGSGSHDVVLARTGFSAVALAALASLSLLAGVGLLRWRRA